MTRGRRALLLGVLAVLLGGLAASDVAGREAALGRRLGPTVALLVARKPIAAGEALPAASLARREVPARYAPPVGYAAPGELRGRRAAVAIPAGTDIVPALLADPRRPSAAAAPVRPGERVAQLTAVGSPDVVVPGSRVDVLVTREDGAGRGSTHLVLQDAEVLAAGPAPARDDDPAPRVAVALRTSLAKAVELTAAQAFASEIRLLPRAPGDRGRPAVAAAGTGTG